MTHSFLFLSKKKCFRASGDGALAAGAAGADARRQRLRLFAAAVPGAAQPAPLQPHHRDAVAQRLQVTPLGFPSSSFLGYVC